MGKAKKMIEKVKNVGKDSKNVVKNVK